MVPVALFLGTRVVGFELPATLKSVGSLGYLAPPAGPAGPAGELAIALRAAMATNRDAGQAKSVERGRHLLDIDDAAEGLRLWYAQAMAVGELPED